MKAYSTLPFIAAAALCFHGNSANAQNGDWCGTDEVRRQMVQANPDLLRQEAEYENGLQAYLKARAGQRDGDDSTVYVIPLVFHILYDPTQGSDSHNVSDQEIFDEVTALNLAYAGNNPDLDQVCCGFESIIGNPKVRWQLATKDPFGNCTNGIDRITSQRASLAGNFSKLDPWFRNHYVNVWVIRTFPSIGTGQLLGFSQLPANVQDAVGALQDGVIMRSDQLSGPGNSNVTLTHELGHFLNLQHTWGNTNDPGVACGDDNVEDTPITKGHQFVCDLYDSFCSHQPTDTAYTFNDVTTTSGTTDPSPVPTIYLNDTLEPGLVLSPFTAVGVSTNSSENGTFAFSQWGTGATQGDTAYSQLTGSVNGSQYYEFTVTPQLGKSMTLSGISFRVNRSATGPRTFAVRSSIGGFGSNLAAAVLPVNPAITVQGSNTFFFTADTTGIVNGSQVTLSGASFQNMPSPLTFRIYAWNAEDASGYFAVDSVSVNGVFGIIENVQNFMEYSGCNHMFTEGQVDRMRATLNSNVSDRNNLWTEGNHAYAGIDGHETSCGPEAGFYPLSFFACTGAPIQFKDNSTRATPTSWSWAFEDGNPSTSDQQNPTVTFNTPGPHTVTLTVANDFGSSSITKEHIVYIGADYSEVGEMLHESFDTEQRFSKWPVINYENNITRWLYENQAGHDAPGCAKLNASQTYTLIQDGFAPNNFSDKDELVTPSLDFHYLSNMELKFWYAYAARTTVMAEITESLEVWTSSNCGGVWIKRKTITGGDLVTAGVKTPGYLPGASDWREVTVPLPSILANSKVRVKFVYNSGLNSNDIFVDDINMSAVVGIDELARNGSLTLMPNPATNHLTVTVDLAGSNSGTLSFLDMTGRTVYSQGVQAGEEQLNFDLEKLGISGGVYLVQLKHAKGQRVERLVVR